MANQIDVKISSDRSLSVNCPEYAGIQGDISAYTIKFDITSIYDSTHSYRVEWYGSDGTFDSSIILEVAQDDDVYSVFAVVPREISESGGNAKVYLIDEIIGENDVTQRVCYYPLKIYFEDKPNENTSIRVLEYSESIGSIYAKIKECSESAQASATTVQSAKEEVVEAKESAQALLSTLVDSELSETSENPVQNKIVKSALDLKLDKNQPSLSGKILEVDENGVVGGSIDSSDIITTNKLNEHNIDSNAHHDLFADIPNYTFGIGVIARNTTDNNYTVNLDTDTVATKEYVNAQTSGAIKRSIVTVLPTEDIDENTIYMILKAEGTTNNIYDEYMYISDVWELIGSTAVDLSNYYTKTESDNVFAKNEVIYDYIGQVQSGLGLQIDSENSCRSEADSQLWQEIGNVSAMIGGEISTRQAENESIIDQINNKPDKETWYTLDTQTLSEDAIYQLENDSNGLSIDNYKKIKVYIELPSTLTTADDLKLLWKYNDSYDNSVELNATSYTHLYATVEFELKDCWEINSSYTNQAGVSAIYRAPHRSVNTACFNSISGIRLLLANSGCFPSGTSIIVKGVLA